VIRILPDGTVNTIPVNAADEGHGFLYADTDDDGEADYIFANNNELTAYNSELALIYRKVFDYELHGSIGKFTLKSGENVWPATWR
jgi:hypothetical protein